MPLFSIIVPIYKVEKWLPRCVESVFAETVSDWELLLVDDGSPDRCSEMCDEYAARDARVRAIHKQNGGLSDARNAGIRAACGEYLLFLDSDDELLRGALERAAAQLEAHLPDALIGRFSAVDEASGRTLFEADCELDEHLINEGGGDAAMGELARAWASPCAWRYIVKREFILQNGLFFEKGLLNEDAMWTPRMLARALSVRCEPQPFYRYYLRELSIMTTVNFKRVSDTLKITRANYDFSRTLGEGARAYCDTLACLTLSTALADWARLQADERDVLREWFKSNAALVRETSRAVKPTRALVALLGPLGGTLAGARLVRLKNAITRSAKIKGGRYN